MIGAARPSLRSIAIAGPGQVALIAALALKQALPDASVEILATPEDPADQADLAVTALTFTNRLHDRLGISEEMMVRDAGATHRLVARYGGWAGPGSAAAVSYGSALPQNLRTAFARHWGGTAQRGAGARVPLSLAEALARAGRFAPPPPSEDGPLAELDYCLRWDRQRYLALLAAQARNAGVGYRIADIADVAISEDRISAVNLSDGSSVSADLFVDCTGPRAKLLSRLSGHQRADWSARLPVRGLARIDGGAEQLRLDDRIILTGAAWVAETAALHRRSAVLGLPEGQGEDVAQAIFKTDAAQYVSFAPGRAQAAWLGNVVAIGDAAIRIEPLGWTNLDLAHRLLDLLIELLPGREIHPLERNEFNRRYTLIAEGACDFVASHYAAPAARSVFGQPEQSGQLAVVLDQFTRRGKIPFVEEPTLSGREWHGVLAALGLEPGIDCVTRDEPLEMHRATISAHESMVLNAAETMPPYAEWHRTVIEGL